MRLVHFRYATPTPFAIALTGTTIDDFGNEVRLEGNAQWHAAADFLDDNFFDDSLGFGAGGWRS
ncbi:hypothetical protein AB6809_29525 [Paraburkholderia sp. RCC_158]|uniref:hypothetical protein n=1 Tax=Paraburkholderia sp. RCC_158 TaxID=3239220 RepID=UPI003523218B